jgi:hypothetical protein
MNTDQSSTKESRLGNGILDKPIDGEFIWYDKDKMLYYYQDGTQIIGAIADLQLEQSPDFHKYYWIRECRDKYYKDRYGDDYRTLFTCPVKYLSDRLIDSKPVSI